MMQNRTPSVTNCARRAFLTQMGLGFGSVALSGLMASESSANQNRIVHLPAKAKNVIWLFMIGGASHMESFDPKPALNKYAGQNGPRDSVCGRVKIALPRKRACGRVRS